MRRIQKKKVSSVQMKIQIKFKIYRGKYKFRNEKKQKYKIKDKNESKYLITTAFKAIKFPVKKGLKLFFQIAILENSLLLLLPFL